MEEKLPPVSPASDPSIPVSDSGAKPESSPNRSDGRPAADRYPWATWGPWAALGGTVAALILGLVLALPILAFDGGSEDDLGTGARIGIQAMTAIGFLAVPFLVAFGSGPGTTPLFQALKAAARRLGFVSFKVGNALKWIGIAVVGYLAFAAVWANFFGTPEQDDIASKLGPVWAQVLLIVIIAPLAEEVCFRGMLFGGFRTRMPMVVAALAAGLVFGLLHYSTGWSTVPQLAVLGAAFALIYDRTGSLWPAILLHMFNNACALAFLS